MVKHVYWFRTKITPLGKLYGYRSEKVIFNRKNNRGLWHQGPYLMHISRTMISLGMGYTLLGCGARVGWVRHVNHLGWVEMSRRLSRVQNPHWLSLHYFILVIRIPGSWTCDHLITLILSTPYFYGPNGRWKFPTKNHGFRGQGVFNMNRGKGFISKIGASTTPAISHSLIDPKNQPAGTQPVAASRPMYGTIASGGRVARSLHWTTWHGIFFNVATCPPFSSLLFPFFRLHWVRGFPSHSWLPEGKSRDWAPQFFGGEVIGPSVIICFS